MNAPAIAPGTTVGGRWQVATYIGGGELGEVYAVRDPLSGQTGALKRFSPQLLTNLQAWAEFDRSAQTVAGLPFDVFAKRIDSGTEGAPWIVTDRVVWPSLAEQVRTGGTLPIQRMSAMLKALAPALDAAHAAGLVHRGLKPANVFVEPADNPTVRITDFGTWRLRAALGIAPGWAAAPGWLGPDAADPAEASTPRMDVFALGLVVFHALTGRSRFSAAEREPIDTNALWLQMLEPIGSASQLASELGATLDPVLDDWFAHALAPRPEERFKTVGMMASRFRSALAEMREAAKKTPAIRPALARELGIATPPAGSPAPLNKTVKLPAREEPPPSSGEQHEPVAMVSAQPLAYLRVPTRPPPPDLELPEPEPPTPMVEAPAAMGAPPTASPPTTVPVPTPATVPVPPAAAAGMPAPPGMPAAAPAAGPAPSPYASTLPTAQAAPADEDLAAYGVPKKRGMALPLAIIFGVIALGGIGVFAFLKLRPLIAQHNAAPARSARATPPPASASAPPAKTAALPAAGRSADAGADAAPSQAIVHFDCDPDCDRIECDGRDVDLDAGSAPLDPGPHRCTGTRHGYLPSTVHFQVDSGQDMTRRLTLTKLRAHPQPAPHPKTTHKKTCGTFINPCK